MEQRIYNLWNKYNNWDFVHELEKTTGYGFDVQTLSGKVIHKTEKKIVISIRVKNKTSFDILQSRIMGGLHTFSKTHNNFVVCNEDTGECYGLHCGFVDVKELNDEFRINYSSHQMEKIDCLKEEYEKRFEAYEQITTKFAIENIHCSEFLVCRELAWDHLKSFSGGKHVTFDEYPFINGASQGGVYYCEKGIYNDVNHYDINSEYPYCMQHVNFKFPITQGFAQTITEIDKNHMGIFKLKILGKHSWWRNTKDNYYTTYHIWILDLLKIPYELVLTNGNVIYWNQLIKGKDCFQYMNGLYELKQKGNTYVKAIMNVTWGNLSQEKYVTIPFADATPEMYENKLVLDVNTIGPVEKWTADVLLSKHNNEKDAHPYKFVTGRIKPFITSFARYFFIKNVLLPVTKAGYEIYTCNTDGFLSNIPKDEMDKIYPISDKMGHLKVDKEYKKCNVINGRNMKEIK